MQTERFFKTINEGTLDEFLSLLSESPSLASARNDRGVSALMAALYGGRTDVVKALLSACAKLDIFEASAAGQESQLEELLGKDPAALNAFSADGFTPLHLACFFGQVVAARSLLERGCEVNATSTNGAELKPINCAAASRDLEAALALVGLLLEHGAAIQSAQRGGYSALHSAAANGNVRLVELLLQRGADPQALADDRKTPLDLARERERPEVVAVLTRGSDRTAP